MMIFSLLLAAAPVIWMGWNHEPDDFLNRRGGRGNGSTYGEWVPKCYDRLHSEELMKKAADAGVNLIYCHYFKGFGLRHEHDNMERTKEIVRNAHRYGVKVIGYCTFGTLVSETMPDEIPDFDDWIARKPDGSPVAYPGQEFRPSPCRLCDGYLSYMEKVIDYGATEIGLDGFHFDNALLNNCHCERCQRAFRTWLADNVPNPRPICGLRHFGHVKIPIESMTWSNDIDRNPVSLWRNRFRHESNDESVGRIFRRVRSHGKTVVFNPAYFEKGVRDSACYAKNGLTADFNFIENCRAVHRRNGTNVTQVLGFKMAQRFGFRLFDGTSFAQVGEKDPVPRETSMRRFYAQQMIYGGIAGTPSATRYMMHGDRMLIDEPGFYALMRTALPYFRDHYGLYDGKAVARTKFLFSMTAFNGGKGNNSPAFLDYTRLSEEMNEAKIPYVVIMDGDIASVAPGETIVLCEMRHAKTSQYGALAAAAARGVRIVRTGPYGWVDENGYGREDTNPVYDLRGIPGVLREIPSDLAIPVLGPDGKPVPGVLVETAVNSAGEFVFSLFNVGNAEPVKTLAVVLDDPRLAAAEKAELFSFEPGCSLAKAEKAGAKFTLEVKDLVTMATIRFTKDN